MEKRKNRDMERIRKPFQGVGNIIRFNWHFYILSVSLMSILFAGSWFFRDRSAFYLGWLSWLILAVSILSLLVSFYIYDLSELYSLSWLDDRNEDRIVNIHAGFDETSSLLAKKFPSAELKVFDFYDPGKHTEISIARARKAVPAFPGTISTATTNLPLAEGSADAVYLILAAHEIRDRAERLLFFKELDRIVKPTGRIIVTEHLRDWPNFLAYNIGFFHFLPVAAWSETFRQAGLIICEQKKITPFITTYILQKNGTAC
jgi:SAM-dependent methyltransferase